MIAFERDFYRSLATSAVDLVSSADGTFRRIVREVLVGKVFPDILIGEWPRPPVEASARRLTLVECALLHSLSVRQATEADLSDGRWSGLTFSDPQKTLFRLAREGLVAQTSRGEWCLPPTSHLLNVRLTGIEAKLSKIEDALAQALTLRLFVHRAYVLMDATRVSIDRAVQQSFRRTGVGLMLGHTSHVEIVEEAAAANPASFEWILASDKLMHVGRPKLRLS